MKLWLDDLRPAPPGWVHARTAEQAMHYLLQGGVEQASFDHDLGEPDCGLCQGKCDKPCKCTCHKTIHNGTHLINWMVENNVWPKTKPVVHSANPIGAAYMREVVERYGPYPKTDPVAPQLIPNDPHKE